MSFHNPEEEGGQTQSVFRPDWEGPGQINRRSAGGQEKGKKDGFISKKTATPNCQGKKKVGPEKEGLNLPARVTGEMAGGFSCRMFLNG